MLFNSFEFLIFFIIVYTLYLLLNHRCQNYLLLTASYVFYSAWDWRFLSLIFISTVVDYFCGIAIEKSTADNKRKLFVSLSIFVNLSILGFFKYFGFFTDSLSILLQKAGMTLTPFSLNVVLPVGISFYTFQTMSYTIDIYRGELKPTKKFPDFALFVAFFPQLVAGPIERARRLLPQILAPRKLSLNKFYEGCYLIFWGLYLKIFIADNLAKIVDPVYASPADFTGAHIMLATYAFAFQIFGDFAGYSNIARGLGKVMGFDIIINFNLPYFATNPVSFWRRWHISLSSWLRDYLYKSLGGNKRGAILTCRNLLLTMLLGGLWHGAGWTFILWGLYHGVLLILHRGLKFLLKTFGGTRNVFDHIFWRGVALFCFFHLTSLGWLIFRSTSLAHLHLLLNRLLLGWQNLPFELIQSMIYPMAGFLAVLLSIQIIQYRHNNLLAVFKYHPFVRGTFYFIIFYSIIIYGVSGAREFIYFQF